MAEYKTYKELTAWIKARMLVKEIYALTANFPKEELYGLVSQMRRAVISVPSNIAEGYGRQYKKETIQFLYIAKGSIYEIESQLYLALDLSYINERAFNEIILMVDEVRKLLNGLLNYFESNNLLK